MKLTKSPKKLLAVFCIAAVILGIAAATLLSVHTSRSGYGPQSLHHDGHTYTFTFSKSAQLLRSGFYQQNPALQGKDLQNKQTLRVDAGKVTDTNYPDKYPDCYPGVKPLLKAVTQYGKYSVCPVGADNSAVMYFRYQGSWQYVEVVATSADTSAAEMASFKQPIDTTTLRMICQSIQVR